MVTSTSLPNNKPSLSVDRPAEYWGYQAELEKIIQLLVEDFDFVLEGAPNSGRFALIQRAVNEIDSDLIRVDCLRSSSIEELLKLLVRETRFLYQSNFQKNLNDFLSDHKDSVYEKFFARENTDEDIQGFSLDFYSEIIKDLVDFIDYFSKYRNRKSVIVLEHFYHVDTWDKKTNYAQKFLQKIAKAPDTSYVIVGFIGEVQRPCDLRVVEIASMSDSSVTAWSRSVLKQYGVQFNYKDGALDEFINTVQGHAGDARSLMKYIRPHSRDEREVNRSDVLRAKRELLEDFQGIFEALFVALPDSQRHLIQCLATDPTSKPHKKNYVEKHNLVKGGSLQSAVKGLQQKGLLFDSEDNKYRLTLPLFACWLREKTGYKE